MLILLICLGLVLSSALGWCETDVCAKTARILLNAATVIVQNGTTTTLLGISNRTSE